jgi:hypothetical protein
MLSLILQALSVAQGPLCSDSVAMLVERDPHVVAAMLDELVTMGRVRVVSGTSICGECLAKPCCGLSSVPEPTYAFIREIDRQPSSQSGKELPISSVMNKPCR